MFYKGRLEEMMNVFKSKVIKRFRQWNAEIEASPDKKTTIDMGHCWEDLFFDNIAHVSLGHDIIEEGATLDFDIRDTTSPWGFVRKHLPISEGMAEIDAALLDEYVFKWMNPMYQLARKVTGKKNFTKYQ